ncbi:MAG TPA: ribonuclease J, partial [Anaerolineae bacterium]|nr:ribonuclease J [Anaerolineae bacterium]
VVIMATGTQGEPTAVLNRLAVGRHRSLYIQEGDTVVLSSHTIPGNEELIHRVVNRLFQKGADVYYDPLAPVHVSGHASQEEQKLLINLLRPRFFVPIHGELRHLKQHGKTARQLGIPADNIAVVENGYVLSFGQQLEIGARVPGGYVFVDGARVGEIGPAVMREREELGQNGFVMSIVRYDRQTGRPVGRPRIITRGFIFVPGAEDLLAQAAEVTLSAASARPGTPPAEVEKQVQAALSRFLYEETKSHPTVIPAVTEV